MLPSEEIDPVSGNTVPPGAEPEEVRDDVQAELSDGEYVVPADVVRVFGVKYFENLVNRGKKMMEQLDAEGRINGKAPQEIIAEDELGMNDDDELPFSPDELLAEEIRDDPVAMAEGGLVQAFDPNQFALGSTGMVTKTYRNDAGDSRSVLFVDGRPLTVIPEGFYEDTGQARQEAAARQAERAGQQTAPSRVMGGRSESDQRRREEAARPPADDEPQRSMYDMSSEELTEYVEGQQKRANVLGRVGAAAGLVLGGGGLLGSIVGGIAKNAGDLRPLAVTNAAARIAEERGLTDLATRFQTESDQIQENLSPIGKFASRFTADGDSILERHRSWQGNSVGSAPSTPTPSASRSPAQSGNSPAFSSSGGGGGGSYAPSPSYGGSGNSYSSPSSSGLSMGSPVSTPSGGSTGSAGSFGQPSTAPSSSGLSMGTSVPSGGSSSGTTTGKAPSGFSLGSSGGSKPSTGSGGLSFGSSVSSKPSSSSGGLSFGMAKGGLVVRPKKTKKTGLIKRPQ